MITILGALILALLVLPSLAACEVDRSIRTAEKPAIERDPAASVWNHEAYPVEVCEWISPVTLTWPHIGLLIEVRAEGIAEQEDPEARMMLGVGALWVGATKEQACLGWGKPINVLIRSSSTEHWIYPRGNYLFFTGDILTELYAKN